MKYMITHVDWVPTLISLGLTSPSVLTVATDDENFAML